MLTENEKILLGAIIFSEYHDGRGPVEDAVWTDCVCECFNNTRTASGVMSSLSKKGFVKTQDEGREAVCWVTQAGFDAYNAEVG